ncbi:MAG: hypothetical protein KDE47_25835 [Caldilineaceae bacterium]|nr:hypothetical protein [Caldilineaceae bacterium]
MSTVTATTILEQIRPLVQELSAEERLTLIRSIAYIDRPSESTPSSATTVKDPMLVEQEAWYAMSQREREQYQGQYVAIYQGNVVDADEDRIALVKRVRTQYPGSPIPILAAEEEMLPEFVVHSQHFA